VRHRCFARLLALSILLGWRRRTGTWHRGIIAYASSAQSLELPRRTSASRTRTAPSRPTKKMFKKCPIFRRGKTSGNSPRLPHISPQLHHKSTTFCASFSPKTPVKTRIRHRSEKARKTTVPNFSESKAQYFESGPYPTFKSRDRPTAKPDGSHKPSWQRQVRDSA
jgi:hypothetical protein